MKIYTGLFIFFLLILFHLSGIAQPVISTNPNFFNITLGCHDSITQNLSVSNSGSSVLSFSTFFKYAYVCNSNDNTVSVIDVTTNTIVGAPIPVGAWPMRAVINHDAGLVYVATRDENSVYVIQTSTNTVIDTIPVGLGPIGLALTPDGNYLYVCNQYDNNVSVVDCNADTVIYTIYDAGFDNPDDIGITRDGKYAYVPNRNTGVTVIDISTNTVITNIYGLIRAHSLIFSIDGKYVFITESFNNGSVVQIDIETNTILRKIGSFNQAVGIDITPDGRYLYAVDKFNDYIQIIEVSSGTVIDTIYDPSFNNGWGIAISPDGKYAYVGISWTNPSIIIIDINSNTVSGNLATSFNGCWGVATLNNIPSWITSGITSDTIPGSNLVDIGFEFNSTGIYAGTYSYNLSVFSNDSLNPVITIPCALTINGQPSMVLSDTCFYFDTTYVTGHRDKMLTIYNTGCDTLKVTGLTPSSQFTVSESNLIILPFDSATVTVTFSPASTGVISGSMTVTTNDYNKSICLNGVGKMPPDITVTPSSLSATAVGCAGDTITRLLTIHNTGIDNLTCDLTLDKLNYDSTIFVQYFTSNAITAHSFPFNQIVDSVYVTVTLNGDYDSGSEYADLYIDGNFIETIPDGNILNQDIVRNYVFSGAQLTNWLSDYQLMVTVDNTSSVGSGGYHIVSISYIGEQWPGMLISTPDQVNIIPGDSTVISVDFISTGKNSGIYSTYLFVSSNDPDTPVDSIYCTLTVLGNPEISVSDTCLNFPSTQLGLSSTDTLFISNTGCDTLVVNAINSSSGEFTFSSDSLPIIILPDSSIFLMVTFTPSSVQAFSGNLLITNNAGNINICLNGTGLPSAIINLIPDTFNVTLTGCNDSIILPLGIYNSGSVNLNYSIDISGAQPPTGYCIPTYSSMCSSADYINRFTFNTLSKLNSGCNGLADNYIYDQGVTTKVLPGSSYSMTMQAGSAYSQGFGVWIDYNRDGDFADAGEFIYSSPGSSTSLYSTNITIPNNVPLGKTMLRVRCRYASTISASEYCSNFSYGETEDYSIIIGDIFVSCSPASGTSLPADTSIVNVKFKSYGLPAGMHYGMITINSDDPVNPAVNLPCTLNVIGVPDINLSDSSINYGSIFQYVSKTDSITVTNSGCGNLNISNITHLNPAYSIDSTSMTISPWGSKKIKITFNPQTIGAHYDTLNVLNNDSNIKIPLYGYALSPPVIAYSPASFDLTTSNCNDSVVLPLTIYNTGDTDLIFSLSGGNVGNFNLDVAVAGSEDVAYLNDVRNKLLATGKFNSVTIVDVRYSTPTLATLQQYDAVLVWMDYSYNNSTALGDVLADYSDNGGGVVSAIFETGYSGHMLGRWDSQQYYVITRGSYISGYTTLGTVFDPGHPIMKNVVSLNGYNTTYRPANTTLTATSTLIANWADGKPLVAVKEKNGNRLVDLGLWPPSSDAGAGSWQSSTNGALLMANALEWAAKFVNWISVSNEADTIAASDSVIVNVTFNTSELITGNYTASLIINSNDPLSSFDTILCNLTLNGHPIIELSDSCINFGSVMQWTQKTDSFTIYNTGCDTLIISDISLLNPVFSVNTTNLVIPPDNDANVLVTFSPVTAGIFSDTLLIYNNDVLAKVCINALSYSPPVLAYFPDSLIATVNICNDSVTLPLTIYNPGDTTLNWNADIINNIPKSSLNLNGGSYVSVADFTGLPSGSVMTVEAWVYPVGLPDGSYNGVVAFGPRVCTGTSFLLSMTNAGRPSFASWCRDFVPTTGPTATFNQWHHIAAVLNGSSIKLYLDGYEWSGSLGTAPNVQPGTLTIGCTDLPGRYFNGRIDEVRIWNQARTAQQINELQNIPLNANSSGLVSYWNFDEGTGSIVSDQTGNGHTGNLIGAGWSSTGPPLSNIALNNYSGSVPVGDSTIVNVTFYTSSLDSGVYYENIVINSNDPINSADTVPCVLYYNGYPVIGASSNCFEFDSIFQYSSLADTLWISNNGCAMLNVTNISNSLSAFITDTASFNVYQGNSVRVIVTFNPQSVGHYYDTLHVFNNDSNINICLHGYAISPPVIVLNPDSFYVTINNCNDSVTIPLMISNTGDTTLTWNIISQLNSGNALSFNGSNNYVQMANSSQFDIANLTMEAWVFSNNFSQNGFIFEKGPVNSQYSMFFEGSNFCFRTVNSSGSMHSQYVNSVSLGFTNGSWHHVACTYDGVNKKIYVDGVLKNTLAYNQILRTGMLGQIIGAYGGTGGHSYYFNGSIDEVRVWNYARTATEISQSLNHSLIGNETGLVAYWTFNEGSGVTAYDLTNNNNDGTISGAGWITSGASIQDNISFNQYSGSVLSSDTTIINVTFNRGNMLSGTYYKQIIISSNDPVNPVDTIPCTLVFTNHPLIDVSNNCLEFDSIFEYISAKDSLWILNSGCDTLFVTNITNSQNEFTLNVTTFSIIPGDSAKLVVTFLPLSLGNFYDTLHVFNNDSDINICLHGYALSPPVIVFNPDSINVSINSCNDSITVPLTIYNIGDTTLTYNLAIQNIQNNNNALQFDGLNDNVDLGTWFNYQTFTIEMWVKPGSTQVQYADIIDNNHTGFRSWVLQQNSTNINQYSWGTNDGGGSSLFTLTANQWTHIAITRDGSTKTNKVYINGSLFSSYIGTSNIPYDGTQFFRLCRWGGGGRYWNGIMDEVRIWNFARTAQQIQQGMNHQLYGSESGLLAYWNLNDGLGTTISDLTGNGYNGTISGAAWTTQNAPIENIVTINPDSGSVYAGDSSIVNVTFHTDNINSGTYQSQIIINSNDPLSPFDTVPCTLNYIGYPLISLSDTCLYFDTILQWETDSLNLVIHNTGCDILQITDISSSLNEFSLSDSSFTLVPGDSSVLTVFFNPITVDTFSANLVLNTNIGSQSVCMNAVSTPPPIISVSPDSINVTLTICNDSAVFPFTIYNSGSVALNYNINAISNIAATLNSYVDTVASGDSSVVSLIINGTMVTSGTYNFPVEINSNDPLNPFVSIPVAFTVTARPSKPVASDTSICDGSTVPDLYAAGTNVNWFNDTSLVHSGNTFTTGDSAIGIYNYYVTQTVDNCESFADTVTLAIYAIPSAPVSSDNTICFENPDALLIATGSNIVWYGDSLLVNQVATGNNFLTGLTTVGSYTFYLTQTVNNCQSPFDISTLTINPIPAPPVVSDTTICFGNPTPDMITSGENIQWYSDSALQNLIHIGDTLSTGITAAGVYTFYATQTSIAYNCQGHASAATLTIDSLFLPPVVSDNAICFGEVTPAFNATGDSIRWYSDPALTILIETGNSYLPSDSIVGTFTYYLTQNSYCGESSPQSATLIINSIPSSPVSSDQSVCFGYNIPDLVATGSNIIWYSDSLLSNTVYSGNTFTTGQVNVGTYVYYFTQTINNCESPASIVSLEIRTTPVIPTVLDTTVCFGDSVPDLFATGNNVQWYSDYTLNTLIHTGNYFSSGETVSGVYVYYVTDLDTVAGCESFSDSIKLTINPIPSAPVAADETICLGQITLAISATGTNVIWYSDSNIVNSGNIYTPSETSVGIYNYLVTQTVSNCESPADTVIFTINPIPSAPLVSDSVICTYNPIPDFIAQGANIRWYGDSTLNNLIYTGDTLTPGISLAGTYNWYVTQTISATGCEGPFEIATLTIDTLPFAPVADDHTICYGTPTPVFNSTGSNVMWYDSSLTFILFDGNSYPSPDTAVGTYIYYVKQQNHCGQSTPDTAVLIINSNPSAPVGTGSSVCYGSTVPPLTASGATVIWYQDSALTLILDTTDSYNSGMSNVGTYVYYITLSQNNCQGPSDTVILDIRNIPSEPVSNDEVICFGTATPDLISTGINVNWYENSLLDTVISTGNIFSTGITAVGSYTFYVTQLDNGTSCESFADTVTLTINAIPSLPVISDTAICFGQAAPSLMAIGTNIIWYSDTNIVNTGNNFIPADTASGSYNYYVTQTVNNCESPADTVLFTINILPPAPVVSDTVTCSGSSTPDIIAQGVNINWYNDSLLSTLVYSGDTLAPGVTLSGIYSWYVTQTVSATGCEGPFETATLTIDTLPFKPIVTDQIICLGTVTPSFTAIGTNVKWYSDSALTVLIQTGNSYTSTEDTVGTYVYFITQSNYCGESSADSAVLTINAIPSPPDASGNSVCFGQPTQTINATGTNIIWYLDSALTIPLDTANSYNPNISAQGTYTFYLTQTVNACQSPADTAVIIIHSLPVPPVANDQYTCTTTIPSLTASGSNIQWYDSSGFVYAGDTFITGQTQYGVYTYYATQTSLATGCESIRDTVLLTISTVIINPPVTHDTASCFGQTVPDLIAQGLNLIWYSDSLLTDQVGTDTVFATGITSPGAYTYWVVQQNICGISPKAEATLIINSLPATPVSSDTSTCKGDTIVLSAIGNNLHWYQEINLSTLLFTGDNYTPTTFNVPGIYTYYLIDSSFVTGCISNIDSLIFTVKDVPVSPVAENDTACFGGNVPDLIATGTNVNWYDDILLTNLVFTGDTFSTGQINSGIYTYYLTQSNECGASVSDTVVLTISNQPGTPAVSGASVCFGDSSSLSAIGMNINWYSDTALTLLVDTGNYFTPVDTAVGIYNWYVTQTNSSTGCISDYSTVSLVINSIPPAPEVADSSVCQGTANPALTAIGSNITWYSDSGLNVIIDTDSIYIPMENVSGIYNYYTTQTVNSCESPSSLVVFTIKALPDSPVATDSSICDGVIIPLLTSSGLNLTWYSDSALTLSVATGSSYQPLVSNPGVYNWYVTQTQNGCVGPYDIATLNINSVPLPPVAADDTICYGAIVPVLNASGTNVIWYGNPALTDTLQNGNNYQPSDTSAGTHIFYVTQTVNNCVSSSNDVIFIVFDSSVPPVASDNSICMGSAASSLTASGVNVKWYSDADLTNLIYSGNTLITNDSLPGTYIYYVTQTISTCGISPSDSAILNIKSIPSAPVVNDEAICFGNIIPDLVATGSNLKWYSEPELIILVNIGTNFNTGNTAVGTYTYYVTQNVNGCTSLPNDIVLTINPTPFVTLNKYHANINQGGSVTLIAYNAVNYSWTPVTGLNIATGNVVVASPLQTTTYIVTGTSNQGCSDTAKCVVEVGQIGVDENNFAQYLSVYPNPTSGDLKIKFVSLQKESLKIRLMNQLGQILINLQSEQNNGIFEETISLENIADGVYYLQVMAEKGIIIRKVVLRR